jgi:hypothetical protein
MRVWLSKPIWTTTEKEVGMPNKCYFCDIPIDTKRDVHIDDKGRHFCSEGHKGLVALRDEVHECTKREEEGGHVV